MTRVPPPGDQSQTLPVDSSGGVAQPKSQINDPATTQSDGTQDPDQRALTSALPMPIPFPYQLVPPGKLKLPGVQDPNLDSPSSRR